MDPRKPSELLPLLKAKGLLPKRSLSQNFLIDSNILDKITLAAEVHPGDQVLEIGPGPGALTTALLEKGAHVTAVEIDQRFVAFLSETLTSNNLTLIHESILDFSFENLKAPLKVIANIPYHITSPILLALAKHASLFSHVVLMVQKEVISRLFAEPLDKKCNALTHIIHYAFTPKLLFSISPHSFYPAPHVESIMISLEPHHRYQLPDPDHFFSWLQTLFLHKRKMIRHFYRLPIQMEHLATARPGELTLDTLIELYNAFFDATKS